VGALIYSAGTIRRDEGKCGWYVNLFELCDLRCVCHGLVYESLHEGKKGGVQGRNVHRLPLYAERTGYTCSCTQVMTNLPARKSLRWEIIVSKFLLHNSPAKRQYSAKQNQRDHYIAKRHNSAKDRDPHLAKRQYIPVVELASSTLRRHYPSLVLSAISAWQCVPV
jgi:hypothetical protein